MPGATITLLPLNVIPALLELINVVVTLAVFTATPFNKSFPKTLVKLVPPIKPFTLLPASSTAKIT